MGRGIKIEEKEAMKLLKAIKDGSWTTKYIMSSDSKDAEILLNLIERLQNELECSISRYNKVKEKIDEIKDNIPYLSGFPDWNNKEYTNKDIVHNCIEVLEEVLEENGDMEVK